MFAEEISDDVKTTTQIVIRYDCNGEFKRCGKLWTLKYKDAKKNFEKNGGKHICRQCNLVANNPVHNPEVRKKITKTNIDKYGSATALNSKENIAIRVKQMFDTQEAIDARNQKIKQTNMQKYGVDNAMKTQEMKDKVKLAMQKKYGVDYPCQSKDIMKKIKESNLRKYGVENVAQLPEVKAKIAKKH